MAHALIGVLWPTPQATHAGPRCQSHATAEGAAKELRPFVSWALDESIANLDAAILAIGTARGANMEGGAAVVVVLEFLDLFWISSAGSRCVYDRRGGRGGGHVSPAHHHVGATTAAGQCNHRNNLLLWPTLLEPSGTL